MKQLSFALGFLALAFCLACGSGSSNRIFIPKGNFSNASLSGQYVYQISGFDFRNNGNGLPYREAGVFVADGNGNITGGADDFSAGSAGVSSSSLSGVYAINNDGTGQIILNGLTLDITLVSSSKLYLIEDDTFLNAGGTAEKQDTSAITAPPSGTFAFRMHVENASVPSASVGALTITAGSVTGKEDVLALGGTLGSQALSGAFNAPVSFGRGTATLNDGSTSLQFFYYVVGPGKFLLLSKDADVIGTAQAEAQSGAPFATGSLSGSYAFGSKGDTAASLGGVNSAGRFSAGNGAITAGVLDSVKDGATSNISFNAGTYTVDSGTGRVDVTLNASRSIHEVSYLVSSSRAFFLIDDSSKVEDGTLDLQPSSSFSNASLNGQFAFVMDGFDATTPKDRVGTLQADGNSGLTLNEVVNAGGAISVPGPLSGTYSVSTNGRTTASISGLSSNLILYLISSNDAYIVQSDSGTEISGTISKQQ
jgi:hypothetical protein